MTKKLKVSNSCPQFGNRNDALGQERFSLFTSTSTVTLHYCITPEENNSLRSVIRSILGSTVQRSALREILWNCSDVLKSQPAVIFIWSIFSYCGILLWFYDIFSPPAREWQHVSAANVSLNAPRKTSFVRSACALKDFHKKTNNKKQ